MKKLLLFAIFLGTIPAISQDIKLQDKSASLEQQVAIPEDSVDQKKEKIEKTGIKKEPVKKFSLRPNELLALEKLQIRLEPNHNSKVVLEVEKETPVLKIDKMGDFYLVCYDGICGYVPRTSLEFTQNGTKEDERNNVPNS
jgi:biopolymer transport protein ExbD